MSYDPQSFEEEVKQFHDELSFPNVTFYNFTGGYDPATGDTDEWTRDNGTTVSGEVTVPGEPRTVTGADGSRVNVRVVVRIRDDTGVTLHAISSESRATEVETPVKPDSVYAVADVTDEGNGLIRIDCVSVE